MASPLLQALDLTRIMHDEQQRSEEQAVAQISSAKQLVMTSQLLIRQQEISNNPSGEKLPAFSREKVVAKYQVEKKTSMKAIWMV